jgi:outer membrane protein assembly factor BamB
MSDQQPLIKWSYQTRGRLGRASPAVAPEGTVYVGDHDCILYAISREGELVWNRKTAGRLGDATSSITDDGTVVISSETGRLYAFSPAGDLLWSSNKDRLAITSPVSTSDGSIIIGARKHGSPSGQNDCVIALDSWGATIWEVSTQGEVGDTPAIAADGTIHFGTHRSYVYALNQNGVVKGRFRSNGRISSSPAITGEGLTLIGSHDGYLYAISPDMDLVWSYYTGELISHASPAIAADGTIYFGCQDHRLYALTPDGKLKWRFVTERPISSSPAVAADGTIYFWSQDKHCYALCPDGSLKWKLPTDSPATSSPAITEEGEVIICNQNRTVLALDEQNGGPAHSAWPMMLANVRRNGRMSGASPGRKRPGQAAGSFGLADPARETSGASPQGIARQNRI